MIDILIPEVPGVDLTSARTLAEQLWGLRSLEEVSRWDAAAALELESLADAIAAQDSLRVRAAAEADRLKGERERRFVLVRPFLSRLPEVEAERRSEAYALAVVALKTLSDQVQHAIEFSPDSQEDVVRLRALCAEEKKEARIAKRTATTEMTAMRVAARQATAGTRAGADGSWSRRIIRNQKEAELRPRESDKAALDRKIIQLDRMILWLERFK